MSTPDFFENLALAESAASMFRKTYPSKTEHRGLRKLFRAYSVPGLRWLWKNGDSSARTTIAARIGIWRSLNEDDLMKLQRRIRARETGRKGGN